MTIFQTRIRVAPTEPADERPPWTATAEVWPTDRRDRRRARVAYDQTGAQAAATAVGTAMSAIASDLPERKPGT